MSQESNVSQRSNIVSNVKLVTKSQKCQYVYWKCNYVPNVKAVTLLKNVTLVTKSQKCHISHKCHRCNIA